jgi:hypothetical protein
VQGSDKAAEVMIGGTGADIVQIDQRDATGVGQKVLHVQVAMERRWWMRRDHVSLGQQPVYERHKDWLAGGPASNQHR